MNRFLRLLHEFDDLGAGDYPIDVSIHVGLPEDVRRLQTSLKETLGLEFELRAGAMYQNAALYGGLSSRENIFGRKCPDTNLTAQIALPVALRFSNFGRFFAIFSCPETLLAAYPLDMIVGLANSTGFRHTPVEVLETRYDGVNNITTRLNGEPYTWFDRFFFYL